MEIFLLLGSTFLVFLTAVLGVFGILGNFIDKQSGKLNKRGYLTITIILVSAIFTIALNGIKTIQERNEARAVLWELNRNLNRIEDVGFEFIYSFPADHLFLSNYRQRILPILEQMYGSFDQSTTTTKGALNVPFMGHGVLLPDSNKEPIPYIFLGHVCLNAEFFKNATDKDPATSLIGKGDLKFLLTRSATDASKPDVHLAIDIQRNELRVWGTNAKTGQAKKNNGKIISLPDLLDSTLLIYFCPVGYPNDTQKRQGTQLLKSLRLYIFGLNISGGKRIYLPVDSMNKSFTEQGSPVYSYNFPDSLEKLNKLIQ